jgi:hypothetical protein
MLSMHQGDAMDVGGAKERDKSEDAAGYALATSLWGRFALAGMGLLSLTPRGVRLPSA